MLNASWVSLGDAAAWLLLTLGLMGLGQLSPELLVGNSLGGSLFAPKNSLFSSGFQQPFWLEVPIQPLSPSLPPASSNPLPALPTAPAAVSSGVPQLDAFIQQDISLASKKGISAIKPIGVNPVAVTPWQTAWQQPELSPWKWWNPSELL